MYFYSSFNPFNPPAPPPAKPPAPEKKEPAKPPANTGPLRMMILIGAGKEALLALLALPPNYTQAVKDATEKFEIPKNFHVRLAVKRGEEPSWLSKFVQQDFLFLADDASYQYCCAGRQVITMHVMVFEQATSTATPSTGTSCPLEIICENATGNAFQLIASAHTEKDITKNPPIGDYVGTMSISGNPLKLTFIGRQQTAASPKKK